MDLGDIVLLPARMVYVKSIRTLAFSDVHIGVEYSMTQQGMYIPPIQYGRIVSAIKHAVKKYRPRRVVIVGDLKHAFSERTPQEHKEVINMLKFLRNLKVDVILIRGNHDNFIRGLLERYDFLFVDFVELGKYIFLHGHKAIPKTSEKSKIMIIGHIHPTIMLSDGLSRVRLPTFLVSNSIIVLPAMTLLLSGFDIITGTLEDEYDSPVLRDIREFLLFAIVSDKRVIEFGYVREFMNAHARFLGYRIEKQERG